jgi:hypothetical protein
VKSGALCVATLKILEDKPFAVTVKLLRIVWGVFYVMFQLKNEVNLLRALALFLGVTLYTRVEVCHHFERVYCFHLQG